MVCCWGVMKRRENNEYFKRTFKRNCDARMVGVLSLSIREAYRYLMELTERESIFQRAEMKKFRDTFGMDWLMLV